jgi:hypothetical protein
MIITQDRSKFDALLKDPANVFMLLFGQANPAISKLHDKAAQAITEPYRKMVWVADLSVLSAAEISGWTPTDDCYVILRATSDGKGWRVACRKPVSDLLQSSGEPASRKMRSAFSETGQP